MNQSEIGAIGRLALCALLVGMVTGCAQPAPAGSDAGPRSDAGMDGGSRPDVGAGRDAFGVDAPGLDAPDLDAPDLDAPRSDTGPCTPDCSGRACGPDPACPTTLCGECGEGQICSAAGACECEPACSARECGTDPRCGVSCGMCALSADCIGNSCIERCVPSCSGRTCGADGCGGSCGTCLAGRSCNASGACVTACVPSCDGTTCGGDGCGGTCACGPSSHCIGTDCTCDDDAAPNGAFTACVPFGSSCAAAGTTTNGYCFGPNEWVFCDPIFGVQSLRCSDFASGSSCHDFGGGVGACTCAGGLDRCGSVGTGSWNILIGCNTFVSPNVTYAVNCGYGNPGADPHCAIYSTSFGTRTACMCQNCQPFYSSSGTCERYPACGSGPSMCARTSGSATSPSIEGCL